MVVVVKGLRIRWLRERHADSLTQVEASSRASMSQSTWAKWESGGHGLAAAQTLRGIAHALDVHPGELFDDLPAGPTLTAEQKKAALIAGRLNGEDLKQWLAIGERLLQAELGAPQRGAPSREQRPRRAVKS